MERFLESLKNGIDFLCRKPALFWWCWELNHGLAQSRQVFYCWTKFTSHKANLHLSWHTKNSQILAAGRRNNRCARKCLQWRNHRQKKGSDKWRAGPPLGAVFLWMLSGPCCVEPTAREEVWGRRGDCKPAAQWQGILLDTILKMLTCEWNLRHFVSYMNKSNHQGVKNSG